MKQIGFAMSIVALIIWAGSTADAKPSGGHGAYGQFRAQAQHRLNAQNLRGQQRALAQHNLNRVMPNGHFGMPPGQLKKWGWRHH